MERSIGYAALVLCASLILSAGTAPFASPAFARNYDCSKAGNANKAACKGTAPAAANTSPEQAPAVAAAKPTAAARHYDCTKAGNANKAACKDTASAPATVAAPVASVAHPAQHAGVAAPAPTSSGQTPTAVSHASGSHIVPWTTKTGKLVHYDCSKAGNVNKQACKQ